MRATIVLYETLGQALLVCAFLPAILKWFARRSKQRAIERMTAHGEW